MQINEEVAIYLPWPTNEQVFFHKTHPVDLIGRSFQMTDAEAVLKLIGDLLVHIESLFDAIHLRIELPHANHAHFLVEVAAMSTDSPDIHALPGVRALPSYLQGCADAYREGSKHMPVSSLMIQCHRDGEFWEKVPRSVSFTEDPQNV